MGLLAHMSQGIRLSTFETKSLLPPVVKFSLGDFLELVLAMGGGIEGSGGLSV